MQNIEIEARILEVVRVAAIKRHLLFRSKNDPHIVINVCSGKDDTRRNSRWRFMAATRTNFEYPRFDLDICILPRLRKRTAGQDRRLPQVEFEGTSDGELTFVSGSPGRTDRQLTVDEMTEQTRPRSPELVALVQPARSHVGGVGTALIRKREEMSRRSLRRPKQSQNVYDGYVAALLAPEIWGAIEVREKKLRDCHGARPEVKIDLERVTIESRKRRRTGENRIAI